MTGFHGTTIKCIKCGTEWQDFIIKNALKVNHDLLSLCENCTKELLEEMPHIPKHYKEFLDSIEK